MHISHWFFSKSVTWEQSIACLSEFILTSSKTKRKK